MENFFSSVQNLLPPLLPRITFQGKFRLTILRLKFTFHIFFSLVFFPQVHMNYWQTFFFFGFFVLLLLFFVWRKCSLCTKNTVHTHWMWNVLCNASFGLSNRATKQFIHLLRVCCCCLVPFSSRSSENNKIYFQYERHILIEVIFNHHNSDGTDDIDSVEWKIGKSKWMRRYLFRSFMLEMSTHQLSVVVDAIFKSWNVSYLLLAASF